MSYYTLKQIFDGFEQGCFDARDLFGAAKVTTNTLANLLGVRIRTTQLYLDENRLPGAVQLALRYKAGDLSLADDGSWTSWRLKGRALVDNHNNEYELHDVIRIPLMQARILHLERELEKLGHQVVKGVMPENVVLLNRPPKK